MAALPFSVPPDAGGPWRYWRPTAAAGLVELGTVSGCEVALPPHFHDEDQITVVLRGVRHFIIAGRPVDVGPGQALRIPAGTPHASRSDTSEVFCLNAYAAPGLGEVSDSDAVDLLSRWGRIEWLDVPALPPRPPADFGCGEGAETIGRAARLAGMSREGFSRRFSRLHGMPPHLFRLTERLNEARRLLRAGEGIAAAAADAGFADQSHLGRWFRRAFGTTPGRYRAGCGVTPVL